MDDELSVELECLRATFGDEDIECTSGGRLITIRIFPHTAEDTSRRFVEARLAFTLPAGYPAPSSGPHIHIQQARGLGDRRERALLQLLRQEAQQLEGELVLGHLCEVRDMAALSLVSHAWAHGSMALPYGSIASHAWPPWYR